MLWSCVGNTRTQRARAYLEHHYFTNAQNAFGPAWVTHELKEPERIWNIIILLTHKMLWSCVGNTRTQRARAYLEHHYFTNAQNALVLRG